MSYPTRVGGGLVNRVNRIGIGQNIIRRFFFHGKTLLTKDKKSPENNQICFIQLPYIDRLYHYRQVKRGNFNEIHSFPFDF